MAKKIKFDFDDLAQKALTDIGNTLVKQGRANMDKISYGRVYIIGGKPHVASRVGDSPNNLTGNLKATIRYEIAGRVLEYGSGNRDINYAKYLEGNMNRPNITRAIIQSETEIRTRVEKLFLEGLKVSND